jgi:hypothetical protein
MVVYKLSKVLTLKIADNLYNKNKIMKCTNTDSQSYPQTINKVWITLCERNVFNFFMG